MIDTLTIVLSAVCGVAAWICIASTLFCKDREDRRDFLLWAIVLYVLAGNLAQRSQNDKLLARTPAIKGSDK